MKYYDTYVGCRCFGLRICDLSECSEICRSMLIEAAHLVKSTLFLQSETVWEKKNINELVCINFQLLKCFMFPSFVHSQKKREKSNKVKIF